MANRRYIDFPIASTSGDTDIILIWQDGVNKQTTKATFLSGLPENLDELNDVAISGLTNGQILRYDSTTGKWENTDQGNLDLNDLNDVSIVSPSNGQVLVYNSSTSKWENSSGGFVPYTGAVTTVNLGAQGLRAGYVRFDTSVVTVPDEQGLMYWDATKSTVALIMNGTLQHIGQDTFFYCKNSTGSSIPKGTSVRFAGTDGASGHILITPFLANGSVPSNYFIGVTAEVISNGSFGQVMHFGELTGINTSGYTAGALLYASTTVAGAFQTTAPVAPNNIVLVAAAVNSKNNGAIVVRPTYGSNINTDEGVKITSPTTGDLLQLQAGGLWENKTLAQVIGSAYVPSTRTITINGTTQDLSANRTYNVGTVTSVAALTLGTSGTDLSSTVANGTTTPVITLNVPTASATNRGALSAADWSTFNAKQNALTLTTTGTSGAATLVGSTLNIPNYSPDLSGYVPTSRTITINGTTQDLSANRTFNVGTVTSVGLSSATSGVTIGSTPVTGSGTITLAIATASGSQNGLLSSTDWTTFNNKASTAQLANYLPLAGGTLTGALFGTTASFNSSVTAIDLIQVDSATIAAFRARGGGYGTLYNTSIRSIAGAIGILQLGNNADNYILAGNTNTGGFLSIRVNVSTESISSGTEALRIFSNSNVFIGNSPSDNGARLQVSGTATVSNTLTGNGNEAFRLDPSSGASYMNFRIGGTSYSLIGIAGTTSDIIAGSALGDLNIRATNNQKILFSTNNGGSAALTIASTGAATFTTTTTLGITIVTNDVTTLKMNSSSESTKNWGFATTNLAASDFGIYQSNLVGGDAISAGTARLYFSGGGNVLIGTTTDNGSKLNVIGRGNFIADGAGNANSGIAGAQLVLSRTSGLAENVAFRNTGGSNGISGTNFAGQIISNGNNIFEIYVTGAQPLVLGTNSTEAIRIVSNGNVGIGSVAPNRKLEVITGNGTTNGIRLTYASGVATEGMDITYLNTGNTTTSFDSLYNSNTAVMQFRMKTAGTAVTAMSILGSGNITMTQNLTVNSGITTGTLDATSTTRLATTVGNVLIGTTTDNGSKLQVNGAIRTAQPVGTTSNGWLLGRALVSGTSTPDRWIRVQIGLEYYDILAVYMGTL